MRKLEIKWQRFVSDGETCSRCASTEEELAKAASELEDFLNKVEIEIVVKKEEFTKEEFDKDPLGSNRIWINERSLEELVELKSGQSECSGVCGPSDCRTIEDGDKSYETIPSNLIVKAGLKVATRMFSEEMEEKCCSYTDLDNEGCCC